jgi:glycosyltransferase involved in cell wall biosynthesis
MVKGSLGSLGIRRAIDHSDHIIAVSESTRQVATDAHGVASDKITTVYHGVAPEWRTGFEQPETPLPEALRDRRFIFSLGNSLPYKNLPRLLQAFAEIADSAPDLTLVFAGRGEGKQHLMQMARSLGVADRIHFAGQLSDGEIRACFQHALFFAFPSLIEGFGLPVLEAMASGCPVLTSNCSSLAEIAGEHAVLVDPQASASIAAGMQRLLTDPELRQQLADRGQHRAANFTWQASAEQTLQVYHHLSTVT